MSAAFIVCLAFILTTFKENYNSNTRWPRSCSCEHVFHYFYLYCVTLHFKIILNLLEIAYSESNKKCARQKVLHCLTTISHSQNVVLWNPARNIFGLTTARTLEAYPWGQCKHNARQWNVNSNGSNSERQYLLWFKKKNIFLLQNQRLSTEKKIKHIFFYQRGKCFLTRLR